MIFLNIFKHLLPNAKAWQITIDKKLRQFFEGLASGLDDFKIFFDEIWLDIFPSTTRQLDQWDAQFGLPANANLTDQDRRDRLTASWRALGGQSPSYIQNTLRDNGFDVYIHEWWEEVNATPNLAVCGQINALCGVDNITCSTAIPSDTIIVRNPFSVLGNVAQVPSVDCGESFAECGEPLAECGNSFLQVGFLLVNKIEGVSYLIPNNIDDWKFILYIGGVNFGDIAQIPASRQNEFEALCLRICPAQQWLGLIVEYI